MRYLTLLIVLCATLFTSSCIENDIPYPDVRINIDGIEGEGFTLSQIDVVNCVATLKVDETTDIRNIRIEKVTLGVISRNTTLSNAVLLEQVRTSRELTGTFDMRTPIYATLSLYQDCDWTIVAEQTIDRRFSVAGQIGNPAINLATRSITAYVAKDADLTDIEVLSLRLGPDGLTSYSPSIAELSGDFSSVRFVDVTLHGVTERWMLYVKHTDKSVMLEQADAWSEVLWLYASGVGGQAKGFRYREKDAATWANFEAESALSAFTATVKVKAATTYEIKAYCGNEETEVIERTTGSVQQLPNGGFEDWSQPNDPWLPFLSDAQGNPVTPYWSTGNNGATTLGAKYNLTTPDKSDIRPGSAGKTSAKLESKWVAVKLAAGNLFVGKFAATRGTDGVVNFGQRYTLRPTAVRLWMKYEQGQITDLGKGPAGSAPAGVSVKVGDNDQGSIFASVGTWTKERYGLAKDDELLGTDDSPVSIDTRAPNTFFNTQGPDVIGYGERIFGESVTNWKQITIPILYEKTDRIPTHIILVCSASRYGDYFTGSRQSKMWIDDVELIYDWPVVEQ